MRARQRHQSCRWHEQPQATLNEQEKRGRHYDRGQLRPASEVARDVSVFFATERAARAHIPGTQHLGVLIMVQTAHATLDCLTGSLGNTGASPLWAQSIVEKFDWSTAPGIT